MRSPINTFCTSQYLTIMINFQENQIQSYGDAQDRNLTVSIQEDGNILKLLGNGWKKIDLPYTITANTVLSFQFKSTTQGEIHGIGFDVDNQISRDRTFKLYGTQDWGIDAFNTYTTSSGDWQTYSIPVGQFYTGEFSYLTFTNDHDVSNPEAESLFRNIRVYEDEPPTLPLSSPIRIEAEDYLAGTNRSTYLDKTAGNSGGQYRSDDVDIEKTRDAQGDFNLGWIIQGEYLTYEVTIPQAGTYDLVARVAASKDQNKLGFSIDQATGIFAFDSTQGNQTWQDVVIEDVSLSAGQHQLRLDMLSTGFNLNYIDLVPVATPSDPNPKTRIEAEDYRTGANGATYFDSTVGNSGGQHRHEDVDIEKTGDASGGFNVGWIMQGEYLTYDVTVPETGRYNLVARVASAQADNRLVFSLDQSTGIFAFDATGGGQVWQDVMIEDVSLSAGQHQLRLDMLSTGFNLNYIDLVPVMPPAIGLTLSESSSDTLVSEGGKSDSYTVVLNSQPTSNVTVTLGTDNQIRLDQSTLTFTPNNWNTPQTITVTAIEDTQVEGTHTSQISASISSNDANYDALDSAKLTVQIKDNDSTGETRDPLKWPFAPDSIWNMPIGSNAQYVDAQIGWSARATVDIDHFYVLSGDDPLQPVYDIANWGPGRSTGTNYQNISLPIPDDLIIADATDGDTPNNSAAFLMPDSRTLVQVNGLTRDRPGGFVYGQRLPYTQNVAKYEDLYGSGIEGGHGGSGLSSIGGSIRLGELTGDDPIRHALKVNLWGEKYFSYTQGFTGGLGYRWPAVVADAAADPDFYGGTTPGLMNGTLLAIPPNVTPESLGITTEAGKKLFYAFQDYGAYVADNTGWDAHAIDVEKGVVEEFEASYGYSFTGKNGSNGPFFDDYMKLFSSLHIVANNGPDSIGGGGTPRAPLAPAFSHESDTAFIGQQGDDLLVGDGAPNRMDGKDGLDYLDGRGGADFLTGGNGNDYVMGGDGNDTAIGDYGHDILKGGSGNDYLDGGAGNDRLEGGEGDDHLSGDRGNDSLDGGLGYDTLIEFGDNNFVLTNTTLTGKGIDSLSRIEHIVLSGGNGDTTLDASAFSLGTVHLDGGAGHDWLIGGDQDDTLVSSAGMDTLTGGAGADQFALNGRTRLMLSSRSNAYQKGDYARITDFDRTQDIIQLEGSADLYHMNVSSVGGISGSAIYLDMNGDRTLNASDELVALVQGVNSLDLNQAYFTYV